MEIRNRVYFGAGSNQLSKRSSVSRRPRLTPSQLPPAITPLDSKDSRIGTQAVWRREDPPGSDQRLALNTPVLAPPIATLDSKDSRVGTQAVWRRKDQAADHRSTYAPTAIGGSPDTAQDAWREHILREKRRDRKTLS